MTTKKERHNVVLWQAETGQQIRAYRQLVIFISDFAEKFESIFAEAFTPEIYEHICNQDFAPIEKLFAKKADQALAATPTFGGLQQQQREHLKGELLKLRNAFDELMKKYFNIQSPGVFLNEIRIVKNRAVWVDADSRRILEKYFTVRLDESTTEIQTLVKDFRQSWNQLADYLSNQRPTASDLRFWNPQPGELFDGFLQIDEHGNITPDWEFCHEKPLQYKADNQ